MATRAPIDREQLTQGVQRDVLAALASDDIDELVAAVQLHVRKGPFTPDRAVLALAVTALDLASDAGSEPLRYEGLRERYLPEVQFRGRVEHRNSQYALYATACLRGGLEPDIDADTGWWGTPLWIYAVYALVIYGRAAAERLSTPTHDIAMHIAARHGLDGAAAKLSGQVKQLPALACDREA